MSGASWTTVDAVRHRRGEVQILLRLLVQRAQLAASTDVTANCAAAHYTYTQLRIWQAGTQPIRETCSSMQQRGQILGLVG